MQYGFYQLYLGLFSLGIAVSFFAAEVFFYRKWSWSFGLRFLWISLFAFLILNLFVMTSVEWSEPQPLQVFVDRSDSISQIEARRKKTDQFLEEIREWAKEKKVSVEFFSFAENLKKITSIDWGGYKTLFEPLESAIMSILTSRKVIISDGLWTDQPKGNPNVTIVSLSQKSDKDIWIDNVPSAFTAFLKNRVAIPIVIREKGYAGDTVEVSLWRGSEKMSSQRVKLQQDKSELEFSYFPEKMGEELFFIRVDALNGELSTLNNSFPFRMRIVRDKIRLLHICGRPSQDLKNWRSFLTRQPDIDLVSFYILRSIEDNPEAKDYELSLIPFPYENLFSVELEKFDVVVLQNFDFNLYFQPFYLSNLARFIEQGGGLLMMGGDLSFHKYRGSPLESLLPFQFGPAQGLFEEKIERVQAGQKHPISYGLEQSLSRESFSGRHRIVPKLGAIDLFKFTSGIPFISIGETKKGRVVAINSDETWKLQMNARDEAPIFSKLGRRILQYLTFDPEMDPLQIFSAEWSAGQKVKVELPSPLESSWVVEALYGEQKWKAEFSSSSSFEVTVPFAGVFQVTATSLGKSQIFETKEQPWKNEWKNLIADLQKLNDFSRTSGARLLAYEDRKNIFDDARSGRQMIAAKTSSWIELNKMLSWIFLLVILILFCADLWWRKKSELDS